MDGWTVIWIAAVVSSIIGFGSLFHMSYIARYWPKATGRVCGNQNRIAHYDCGSGTVYVADVRFEAEDGRCYTIKSDVGLQQPWTVGDTITVHYKPANPNQAMIMTFWERILFSAAFIAPALTCWALLTGILER
ncbi:MAG: DUF3592 domain-containing protein [Alphaproteobacteria bacterium]|nr:DUF3592 domain-containing protein [Alphaproteobacteria bacterium]